MHATDLDAGAPSTTPVGGDDPRDLVRALRSLDAEETAIAATVRRFVDAQVLPHVPGWFERGEFPARELATQLGDLGLLGMHLHGYGCTGSTATAYGMACLELEACDSGLRSFVSVQGSLAMFPIRAFGSDEQRREWLPRMAAGDVIGCFGLTEADSGSDPGSMRTTARRRPNGDWVLDGSKMWITNGSVADVAIIWARTDEGIRGFVVPTDTAGFSAHTIDRKLSLRASTTSELVLDDVVLPAAAMLPGAVGLRGPLSCLNEARFGILFGAVGAARACYEAARAYTLDRSQFGSPIAGYQLTQQKLAEMAIAIAKGLLLAIHLGRNKDDGLITATMVSIGKLDNTRMALDVARTARGMLGANGITLDYPIIRHMNNLESVVTYEGTHEIHLLSVGQAITGIPAFR